MEAARRPQSPSDRQTLIREQTGRVFVPVRVLILRVRGGGGADFAMPQGPCPAYLTTTFKDLLCPWQRSREILRGEQRRDRRNRVARDGAGAWGADGQGSVNQGLEMPAEQGLP